jgi:saccharopine dehydrogenase-like NADP-dependent oxidoreductase
MHTVLVLGGYGFFGNRIAQALASDRTIKLVLAGRNLEQATRAAGALGLPVKSGVALDTREPKLAGSLKELQVDTVIQTAGPFQDQDYRVARAAIDAGCNYIDLADGRAFVAGIRTLDDLARARGVTVISGASSVPALSSGVVDRYLERFGRLNAIRMGISSGARAPGLATVKGVFSNDGKSFLALQNGIWRGKFGWLDLTRHEFPQPLGSRWLGNCDIPDLDLFPKRYPTVETVSFQAGFASNLGHLVVWSLAGLVKLKILPSLGSFAGPLNRISRWIEPLVSREFLLHVTGICR